MRTLAAACILIAASSSALADSEAEAVDALPRFEGSFGLRVGSFNVGPVGAVGFGYHLDAGERFDRLQLIGEYSYLSISETPPTTESTGTAAMGTTTPATDLPSGFVHRFGADARYSVARFIGGDSLTVRGDFWLEGGLGVQMIRWDRGGELRRGDVAFGFGGQVSFRFGDQHAKHVGIYYSLFATFARAPDSYTNQPPTCAGPCDMATRPVGIDRSFLFNLGLIFGN